MRTSFHSWGQVGVALSKVPALEQKRRMAFLKPACGAWCEVPQPLLSSL